MSAPARLPALVLCRVLVLGVTNVGLSSGSHAYAAGTAEQAGPSFSGLTGQPVAEQPLAGTHGADQVGQNGGVAVRQADAAAVPEPSDYRTEDYKAPVPATLAGGTVVDTAAAKRLHDAGVPFIDVLPRAPRPKGLPADTIWRPKPRRDIPGSLWLVDTGYGDLAPIMERYLLDGVAEATGGDKAAPVLFYCKRHCWMSYNAAKRAIRHGYRSVYWYPEGTEGWSEAGYALEANEPKDRPDE